MSRTLANLTPKEIDSFVMQSRKALISHSKDAERSVGRDREDFLAARVTILNTLLELAEVAPPEKVDKIKQLVMNYS